MTYPQPEIAAQPVCPLRKKYGQIICIDGALWALTFNECAPPGQRQWWGDCPHCNPRLVLEIVRRVDRER